MAVVNCAPTDTVTMSATQDPSLSREETDPRFRNAQVFGRIILSTCTTICLKRSWKCCIKNDSRAFTMLTSHHSSSKFIMYMFISNATRAVHVDAFVHSQRIAPSTRAWVEFVHTADKRVSFGGGGRGKCRLVERERALRRPKTASFLSQYSACPNFRIQTAPTFEFKQKCASTLATEGRLMQSLCVLCCKWVCRHWDRAFGLKILGQVRKILINI